MYGCKASLDEHWALSQFPDKLRASLYPCMGSRAVSLPGAWPVLRAKVNDDDFDISKMYKFFIANLKPLESIWCELQRE